MYMKPTDLNVSVQSIGKDEMGVFARRVLATGTIVIQGEIIQRLNGNSRHASQVGIDEFVLHGGPTRFVNHSCDPNCGVKVNKSGAHDLVALSTILPGQEITFDYAMRNYVIEHFPPQCLCGSANCRGSITGWKDLPNDLKAKYRRFCAPYLLEIDAAAEPPLTPSRV